MDGPQEPITRGKTVVRFKITPLSDYFDEKDPRYASEAFELERALRRELPDELEVRPAPDQKGILSELIVDITSSGAIASLVAAFKAWLATRPVHRKIDLEFEIDEKKGQRTGRLSIDATNIDSQNVAEIAGEAFRSKG